MPIQGWKHPAALLLAGLAVTATAGSSDAAEPVGTVIAQELREAPLLDERGRLVFMTAAGTIRVLDSAEPGATGRDVTSACRPELGRRAVQAVAGDHALLHCIGSPGYGTGHVLELATGRLVELDPPPALDSFMVTWTGIAADGVCFSGAPHKGPRWLGRLDWRTGAIADGGTCPSTIPRYHDAGLGLTTRLGGPELVLAARPRPPMSVPFTAAAGELVTWGVRTLAPQMGLYAYLGACGARLGWDASPLTRALPIGDALLLSESTRGHGPVTLRRVPLDGACERVTRPWSVTLASAGRRVAVPARTAAGTDSETGATTRLLRPSGAVPSLRTSSRRAVVTPATAARTVRWRIGDGRWRTAARHGARWTLDGLPQPARRRVLALDVRGAGTDRSTYQVRLR